MLGVYELPVTAVFALVVTVAVGCLLFDVHAEVVMAGVLFVTVWQAAEIVGPSPWLFVVVLLVAAAVDLVLSPFTGGGERGGLLQGSMLEVVDAVLTRKQRSQGQQWRPQQRDDD